MVVTFRQFRLLGKNVVGLWSLEPKIAAKKMEVEEDIHEEEEAG